MSKEIIKQFSLDDLALIRQDKETESLDFFIAKLGFIASGDNRQDCFISEETIREYAPTIKGKFITAKYSWWEDDVMSHEKDLDIIGYVPPDSEITYERTEDGRLMAYCEAVLSKIYCYDVYELFKEDNYRAVSAEFSCTMKDEDSDTGEIVSMNFHSITILGKKVAPAIPNANIKIIKFSKEKANNFYEEQNSNSFLKQFAENRKRKLDTKEVKKFNEEEDMAQEKDKKPTNTEDVVMEEKKEMSDDKEIKDKEKEMSEDKTEDKEMSDEEKKFEDTQEKADKKQDEEDDKEEEEIEKKEFSEEYKKEDKKFEEEEKKFSLEAYVDATATLAMLEKETSERKELASKVLKEMGADKLFSTIMELSAENEKLKKYQEDKEKDETERKFSVIMADVKGDIPEEDYNKLYQEGKTLKFSEMENFGIRVKAFAYDKAKNKTDSFRVGIETTSKQSTSNTIEDIYNEYL